MEYDDAAVVLERLLLLEYFRINDTLIRIEKGEYENNSPSQYKA